jgi:hypothetical protein
MACWPCTVAVDVSEMKQLAPPLADVYVRSATPPSLAAV